MLESCLSGASGWMLEVRERDSETGVRSSSYLSESEAGSENPADCPVRTVRPQKEAGQQPLLAGLKVWVSSGLIGELGCREG